MKADDAPCPNDSEDSRRPSGRKRQRHTPSRSATLGMYGVDICDECIAFGVDERVST